jgi:multidrug efflux pump subunit AcrA (membrane-fusion protein)
MLQYTHEELMAFYFASITPPIRFRPLDTSVQLTADKRALIEVKGEEIENTLIVLPNAVHQEISDGTGYQFYVYSDNNGARERTNIKCGLRSDVAVEVLEGLEEGDMVYVD